MKGSSTRSSKTRNSSQDCQKSDVDSNENSPLIVQDEMCKGDSVKELSNGSDRSDLNKVMSQTSTDVSSNAKKPRKRQLSESSQRGFISLEQLPKDLLEQTSWSWIQSAEKRGFQITDNEVHLAYHLHFPTHFFPDKQCKKNCKNNPRCYFGLNAMKWTMMTDSEASEQSEDEPDPYDILCPNRREEGVPTGLKNLGNTCYVNSFLQIWFNNIRFREAVYKWDPFQDPDECNNETLLDNENYYPKGATASLQALFALMEFTNRSSLDPNDLVGKLGIDPQVQQDAQEFSKLFLSFLEKSFSYQKNPELKEIVQKQFRGGCETFTRCCNCKKESTAPSHFYELNLSIQGQKTLSKCLENYFIEEKLEGSNQYLCSSCNSMQNASHGTRLTHLPPVLNLHLKRYTFELTTGRKKKVNTLIQFPEEIDFAPYLRKSENAHVYCLTGVLMHVGSETYQGHYLAHILDPETNQWYKFSDEVVEKLSGKNPQVGNVADPLQPAKKKPKSCSKSLPKGIQSSSNAYMLVYMEKSSLKAIQQECLEKRKYFESVEHEHLSQDEENSKEKKRKLPGDNDIFPQKNNDFIACDGISLPKMLPPYLRSYIFNDRKVVNEEQMEAMEFKRERLKERYQIRNKMRDICEQLPFEPCVDIINESESGKALSSDIGPDDNFEFIPTSWLSKYLDDPRDVKPIDTTDYLCIHGKIALNKISQLKVVDECLANIFYEDVGKHNGPRLVRSLLCKDCVLNTCRRMLLHENCTNDAKAITELMKIPLDETKEAYWVGKTSLRQWRKVAKLDLEQDLMADKGDVIESNENHSETKMLEMKDDRSSEAVTFSEKTEEEKNHGNGEQVPLHKKRAESSSVPNVPENSVAFFNADVLCDHGELCYEISRRKLVSDTVWSIFEKYFPKAPKFPKSTSNPCPKCGDTQTVVSLVQEEVKALAHNQRNALQNLFYHKSRPTWSNSNLSKIYLVTREFVNNWRSFITKPPSYNPPKRLNNEMLLCCHGGLLFPLSLDSEADSESIFYMVSEDEWHNLQKFFDVDFEVSVTRVKGEHLFESSPEVCAECVTKREQLEENEKLHYRDKPIYVRLLTASDKPLLNDATDPDFSSVSDSLTANAKGPKNVHDQNEKHLDNGSAKPTSIGVRRSNRRQKVRGEKEIIVSSDMILRDLKVKLMEVFKVAPFDQNLSMNGENLIETTKTLAELKVFPQSLIYLRADEPSGTNGPENAVETWTPTGPEEGFKGTGLLSGF